MRYSLRQGSSDSVPVSSILSSSSMCVFSSRTPLPSSATHKSRRITLLRTLGFSCLSFSLSFPLFSSACRLFCQNTGGGGTSATSPRSLPLGAVTPLIDFQNLCFHKFTNPFSSNSFSCTSIQNPRVSPLFRPLHNSSTLTLLDSCALLFRLDFVPRTKYCSTANYCSQECGW